jgi:hypothetical protein
MLGLGTLITAFIIIGFYAWGDRRRRASHVEEFPEGITETDYGVPRMLVLLYSIVGVCMVGYVLYVWLRGVSF